MSANRLESSRLVSQKVDSTYWKSISSRERLSIKRKRAVCLSKISNNLTISDSISLQYACQYVHVTLLVLCDTHIASRTKPESLVYRKCFLTKQIGRLQFSGHRKDKNWLIFELAYIKYIFFEFDTLLRVLKG